MKPPLSYLAPQTQNVLLLTERDRVLALAPVLESFAGSCLQPGALHWLGYFLDKAVLNQRVPRMVLFLRPDADRTKDIREDDLRAVVLFFEYKLLGFRTGVVATGDAVGFNSVVAPAGERAEVAAAASRLLLSRGAVVVLTTYEGPAVGDPSSALSLNPGLRWATRQRVVQRILQLGPTLDATLARMGKSTRFNLRYYRRRLEKQMPCTFVAEAAPLLQSSELSQLNATSLNPVSSKEFARRVASASKLPGSFLCGLRGPQGQWLSLVGGWRQKETTVLYWQMNAAGLEKHSIGTVMRSHLLEAEIARGAERLLIFGGTPHSMRHAFEEDVVADLLLERTGLQTRLIRMVAGLLSSNHFPGRGNFVAEAFASPTLEWRTGAEPSREHEVLAVERLTGRLGRSAAR